MSCVLGNPSFNQAWGGRGKVGERFVEEDAVSGVEKA
jgi:hypothetical protein